MWTGIYSNLEAKYQNDIISLYSQFRIDYSIINAIRYLGWVLSIYEPYIFFIYYVKNVWIKFYS